MFIICNGLVSIAMINNKNDQERNYKTKSNNPVHTYYYYQALPQKPGIMVSAGIIERKLRSTKVRLFTVPCCSIILFSSGRVEKKRIWIYS